MDPKVNLGSPTWFELNWFAVIIYIGFSVFVALCVKVLVRCTGKLDFYNPHRVFFSNWHDCVVASCYFYYNDCVFRCCDLYSDDCLFYN